MASSLAVASVLPSGENATLKTQFLWASHEARGLPARQIPKFHRAVVAAGGQQFAVGARWPRPTRWSHARPGFAALCPSPDPKASRSRAVEQALAADTGQGLAVGRIGQANDPGLVAGDRRRWRGRRSELGEPTGPAETKADDRCVRSAWRTSCQARLEERTMASANFSVVAWANALARSIRIGFVVPGLCAGHAGLECTLLVITWMPGSKLYRQLARCDEAIRRAPGARRIRPSSAPGCGGLALGGCCSHDCIAHKELPRCLVRLSVLVRVPVFHRTGRISSAEEELQEEGKGRKESGRRRCQEICQEEGRQEEKDGSSRAKRSSGLSGFAGRSSAVFTPVHKRGPHTANGWSAASLRWPARGRFPFRLVRPRDPRWLGLQAAEADFTPPEHDSLRPVSIGGCNSGTVATA